MQRTLQTQSPLNVVQVTIYRYGALADGEELIPLPLLVATLESDRINSDIVRSACKKWEVTKAGDELWGDGWTSFVALRHLHSLIMELSVHSPAEYGVILEQFGSTAAADDEDDDAGAVSDGDTQFLLKRLCDEERAADIVATVLQEALCRAQRKKLRIRQEMAQLVRDAK